MCHMCTKPGSGTRLTSLPAGLWGIPLRNGPLAVQICKLQGVICWTHSDNPA
jgi:hypothetical protein